MLNIFKKENRHLIQALGALAFNGNLSGFFQGQIYKGQLKKFCVPVLNCYSCPGALGACPIGSLQAIYGSSKKFSFYVLGLLLLFGILLGRFFCGFLCPFGFIQDLLYKLKIKKFEFKESIHNKLIYIKYFNLFILVIILPALTYAVQGLGIPYFCQYICPAGIGEGAIPLLIRLPYLRGAIGPLFFWKFILFIIFIVTSMKIYRVFCKYICPLGAFYGLCNKHSFYKLYVDDKKCIKCKKCQEICKMHIKTYKDPNSPECIRCLDCKSVCPTSAIENKFKFNDN